MLHFPARSLKASLLAVFIVAASATTAWSGAPHKTGSVPDSSVKAASVLLDFADPKAPPFKNDESFPHIFIDIFGFRPNVSSPYGTRADRIDYKVQLPPSGEGRDIYIHGICRAFVARKGDAASVEPESFEARKGDLGVGDMRRTTFVFNEPDPRTQRGNRLRMFRVETLDRRGAGRIDEAAQLVVGRGPRSTVRAFAHTSRATNARAVRNEEVSSALAGRIEAAEQAMRTLCGDAYRDSVRSALPTLRGGPQ